MMFFKKKDWVLKNTYTALTEIPLSKWISIMNGSELSLIIKTKAAFKAEYIDTIAENVEQMTSKYLSIVGDIKYTAYKEALNELVYLREKRTMLSASLVILGSKESENALLLLKKCGLRLKFPLQQADFKRIIAEIKATSARIEAAKVGLKEINESNTGEETESIEDSTRKSLITISRWQHNWLDYDKITAFDYAVLVCDYNNYLKILDNGKRED